MKTGTELLTGFNLPVINRLIQTDRTAFQFLAYQNQASDSTDPGQQQLLSSIYRMNANQIASSLYAPEFQSQVPEWQPSVSQLDVYEENITQALCPDIVAPNFRLKKFDVGSFSEFQADRPAIQTLAVQIASCTGKNDSASAAALSKRIQDLESAADSQAVKDAFGKLLAQLQSKN